MHDLDFKAFSITKHALHRAIERYGAKNTSDACDMIENVVRRGEFVEFRRGDRVIGLGGMRAVVTHDNVVITIL